MSEYFKGNHLKTDTHISKFINKIRARNIVTILNNSLTKLRFPTNLTPSSSLNFSRVRTNTGMI